MRRRTILTAGALFLAGIVVLAAVAAIRAGGPPREQPLILPSGEKLRSTREGRAAAGSTPKDETDLLDAVDLSRDVVAGPWGFQGPSLCTAPAADGRLQLPLVPPLEYDLRMTVARKHGTGALNVGFVYGGCQGVLHIDGDGGEKTWIDLAGISDLSSNPTAVHGKQLKWNRPTRIVLSVRRELVSLRVGEISILEWKGGAAELRLPSESRIPDRHLLSVGSTGSIFRIDELCLRPAAGTPVSNP